MPLNQTTSVTDAYDPLQEITSTNPVAEPQPAEVIIPTAAPVETPAVQQKYFSAFSPVTAAKISDLDITQRLPNLLVSDDDLEACYQLCEQLLTESTGDANKHRSISALIEAFYQVSTNTYGSEYKAFFDRNVGNLVQYVVGHKGTKIRTSYPEFNISENTEVLSGKPAIRYLNKLTKTGNTTKIPLWHSGLWVTIDPFSEIEMLDLNLALSRHQLELGLNTRGASFTGDDIHVVGTIVDFILAHVIDCNLKDFSRTSLQKLILSTDIPALLAGALAAIYPSGYPVFHTCVNKEAGICNYNITAKRKENGDFYPDSMLDFTKMLWVDQTHLTAEDNMVMSSLSRSLSYDEIKKYQSRIFGLTAKDAFIATIWKSQDGLISISVGFKTPSIAEYAITSSSWINNVKKMTELAIAAEVDLIGANREEQRHKILNSYSAINDLVKHAGWVDFITSTDANGESKNFVDEKTIKEALESFIQLDGFKMGFEKAVQYFKESTVIAWTGIPNFECPECHAGQTDPNSPTPSLIPINMAGYFFSTMEWRKQMRQQMD